MIFWHNVSKIILKNRAAWIIALLALTVFMGWKASKIELSYEMAKILSRQDPDFLEYENFKNRFGEDGNVLIIGIESNKMYDLETFSAWYDLNKEVKTIEGIKNVVSNANLSSLHKNETEQRLDFLPLLPQKPQTQAEVDSLKTRISRLPFYKELVYAENSNAHLMAVTFSQTTLNSKSRISIVEEIKQKADAFGKKTGLEVKYSGMPYIRTKFTAKVSQELQMFLMLAFGVTIAILFIFFRNLKIVFFVGLVVLMGVITCVGTLVLFDYKITLLTGLIPPIIIVIGIPNCIFLINKYQEEYVRTKDQMLALSIAIEKIGKTTFLANVTTSIGFFVFYFTGSPMLLEFGLVSAVSIMATWLISLALIPITFSFLAPPSPKSVQHLENKHISRFLHWVDFVVHHRRTKLYWVIGLITAVSFYGMTLIRANGHVVDDLPQNDPIFRDLKWIENHFQGVVPIEVAIDTKHEGGVMQPEMLNKIKVMQREFSKHQEFTKPVSLVEAIKFIYQGYRGGDEKYYQLPGALELGELANYSGSVKGRENDFASFIDSTQRYTRVSFQMADIGTAKMKVLIDKLQPKVDSIFNFERESQQWKPKNEQVSAKITGNGFVFMKGNEYLLQNLQESTLLAIFLVCLVMATQFFNIRLVLISTLPSIIPLIITAGIMGFFGINLKPSTILIFSIAFGISSDGTIYFLTKYKDEIVSKNRSIAQAVTNTILYTGISMFYTAIILFAGFFIFTASTFKGTVALGLLVSITLLMGMIANLILLPAFLMTLEKKGKI